MSVRAALLGSLAGGAFVPLAADAHGLGNHADSTLGAIFYFAEIGLALAFAVFVAWTLYNRFRQIETMKPDKEHHEHQAREE